MAVSQRQRPIAAPAAAVKKYVFEEVPGPESEGLRINRKRLD